MRGRHWLIALLVLPLGAHPPDKVELRWGLKPHDFLHYRCDHYVDDQGKQVLREFLEHPVDLFGCDFDKDGRYARRVEGLYDVPVPLVLSVPDRPVAPGDKWKVSAAYDDLWTYPRLVANGTAEYLGAEALDKVSCHVWKGVADVEEEKGKSANVSREWLGGKVEWKTWFEADPGVVRRVELTWTATHIGHPKVPNEKPAELKVREEWTRGEVWRDRFEEFQKRVDEAIDKGVAWVKGKQKADGSWDAHYDYSVGPTALALLTLIKGGCKHADPAVTKALGWIVEKPFGRTYEVALSMIAVEGFYTPPGEQEAIRRGQIKEYRRSLPPEHVEWMRKAVRWMEQNAFGTGDWGYPGDRPDLSNTQYAILALHAAGRCGIWADEEVWLRAIRGFLNLQQKQGPPVRYSPKASEGTTTEIAAEARGFPYRPNDQATVSMTCAGIACVSLSRDALQRMKSKKWNKREDAKAVSALKDAVGWLSDHYDVRLNEPVDRGWYWYALYGLERAGTLADFDRLGGHDWYYEGALVLVVNQKDDGHWQDSAWVWLHDNCFAILFLKRATSSLPTK